MLKQNPNFMPSIPSEGDECFANGIFIFNISKMLDYINENLSTIELTEIKVKDYYFGAEHINEDHLDSVDVTNPIILAEISPSSYNIIDGNHRLTKAYRQGLSTIPAYKLSIDQIIPFLVSKVSYVKYIEYLNEKMKRR